MMYLELVDIASQNAISPGSTDFVDLIRVTIKHISAREPRILYIPVYSLSSFLALQELEVKEINKAFIMGFYDLIAIKNAIVKLVTQCDAMASVRSSALCLDGLMTYEHAAESDPWVVEQHDFERYGYKIIQKKLTDGALYPDNIECCNEVVLLTLQHPEAEYQVEQKINIVTVLWLESALKTEPVLYFKKAFVRRFFDYDNICL